MLDAICAPYCSLFFRAPLRNTAVCALGLLQCASCGLKSTKLKLRRWCPLADMLLGWTQIRELKSKHTQSIHMFLHVLMKQCTQLQSSQPLIFDLVCQTKPTSSCINHPSILFSSCCLTLVSPHCASLCARVSPRNIWYIPYIHIFMYSCIRVYVYIYIYVHMYMYVYIYNICVCIYVPVYI